MAEDEWEIKNPEHSKAAKTIIINNIIYHVDDNTAAIVNALLLIVNDINDLKFSIRDINKRLQNM